MMICHESNTTIKKTKQNMNNQRNINIFLTLFLNKYIVKDIAVDKFKDIITSYYNEHMKKILNFTVAYYWDVDDGTYKKISVPNRISYVLDLYGYSTIIKETACDFSNRIIINYFFHDFSPKRIRETEIVFISDLKDMTFHHYLEQPMPKTQRKMIRRFFEVKREDKNDFEYSCLPGCLCVIN